MDENIKMSVDDIENPVMAFEPSESSAMMQFESLSDQSSYIKVIGVGGGGGNAVNHMYRQGIRGVDFIVCNTDLKALNSSPVPNKIVLGKLGAGNVPERARKAALNQKDQIREAISHNTQMLFITAGMGGGTGTGAAPVIAEIAKSIELDDEEVSRILVVAIVTMPFSFEGARRKRQAEEGIEELKKHVDSILVINNDKLKYLGNVPLNQAFSKADDVLLTAAKGIAEIITVSAYVNIDFRDVNTVMENSGTALMGAGEGRGESRAKDAIVAATTSVLLNDNDIRGAKNILLYFSYGPEHQITMNEIGEVTDYLIGLTGDVGSDVIWGAGEDESLNDELKITLIATGFEQLSATGEDIVTVYKLGDKESDSDVKLERRGPAAIPAASQMQTPAHQNTPDVSNNGNRDDEPHLVKKSDETRPVAENKTENIEGQGERRVFVLEDNDVDDSCDVAENTRTNESSPSASSSVYNDVYDGIRVVPRSMAQTAVDETTVDVATMKAPERNLESRGTVKDVANHVPYETMAHDDKPQPMSATDIQKKNDVSLKSTIDKAFTPERTVDDLSCLSKADRIRRMNELLHGAPDGVKAIENMTTEQLVGEPVAETVHSSVSEASGMAIGYSGFMMRNTDLLGYHPD